MSSQLDQYRMTSIQTAPPDQLLLMLYDGAIKFLDQAKVAIDQGRNPSEPIGRAQDIVLELHSSLDTNVGDISRHLANLYEYFSRRLLHAQIHRDTNVLEEVSGHMRSLREAWATAAIEDRKQKRAKRPEAVAPTGD